MNTLLLTVLWLILSYLFLSAAYQLVLALASKAYQKPLFKGNPRKEKLLVLVPTYRSDEVILHTTRVNLEICKQEKEITYAVIADSLQKRTQDDLKKLGVEVLEVCFQKSTKAKSLKYAMEYFEGKGKFDSVFILDADNILHPDFYKEINFYKSNGHQVIQGQRLPANQTTGMAVLDGLSEKANQEMLCKGANLLGFSSKLTGSAMVFDFNLFGRLVKNLTAVGGFDKELELALTSEGISIQYAPEICVFDEKVSNSSDFAKQRGRWLESQYTFLKKSIGPAMKMVKKGNFDYLHKSLQLALPPRVLAPMVLVLFVIGARISGQAELEFASFVSLITLILSYLIVIPVKMWVGNLGSILMTLPALFIAGIRALTWMKKSKKEFLHTTHQATQS